MVYAYAAAVGLALLALVIAFGNLMKLERLDRDVAQIFGAHVRELERQMAARQNEIAYLYDVLRPQDQDPRTTTARHIAEVAGDHDGTEGGA